MKELFVSKKGDLTSVEAARDEIRRLKAAGETGPFAVRVASGEYKVKTISFGKEDGGVTYRAEGNVILSGGMTLDPSIFGPVSGEMRERLRGEAKDKVVCANLARLGLTRADWGEMCAVGSYHTANRYDGSVTSPMWCELFVGDVRQTVARYPDDGWLHTCGVIREGKGLEHDGSRKDNGVPWEQLRNPTSDILRIDPDTAKRAASWKSLDGVWVLGYPKYDWADASSPVLAIDAEASSIEPEYVSMFGTREKAPYYFYNVFEELDSPGEWYLDRGRGILYLYPACDLSTADIVLSISAAPIIKISGASDLAFDGFTMLGTRGNAIEADGDGIVVENCIIKNVAGNAAVINGSRCAVRGCEITRTGGGGVYLTGGDRNTLTPSGNIAENNHVHHISEIFRTYHPAFSLGGVGAVCRGNTIHDLAHMAISFGGNDHVMERNDIYRVCLIADDSSAIYSGRDYTTQGNIVRYNRFHDMKSDADSHIGIFGMYCDDNLGSCDIEHNIFENCQSALLLHGGHDMIFRYNVIIGACPKSVYSIRFHRYGYWHDLEPGGTHEAGLKRVPWQSGVWRERYPHLAEYLTWDPGTEQCYPHYCDISDNVLIAHKPIDINFQWDDPRFRNRVENNVELEKSPVQDLKELCEKVLPEMIDGFAPIPVGDIGAPAAPRLR
ncbi:MAG: right-handed parallel beta-helix repeat-containing protein [Clostridiales bacterium]|nr:right-handed parallel beta-helix repeat-containing protein [Clostridiales bacterium]